MVTIKYIHKTLKKAILSILPQKTTNLQRWTETEGEKNNGDTKQHEGK